MSEEVSPSRLRTPKASERQKIELVKYFEKNVDALRIVNGYPSDHRAKQRIWIDLAHRLNCLEGALKTSLKWAKYWHDIIIYTKTRAKNAVYKTNGAERPPTEIEKRILLVMGEAKLLKDWKISLEISSKDMPKTEPLSDEDNEFSFESETRESGPSETILINPSVEDPNSSNQIEYLKSSTIPRNSSRFLSEEQYEFVDSEQPCKRTKISDDKMERILGEVLQLKSSFREMTSSLRTIAEGFQMVSNTLLRIASNVESSMNNGGST